MKLKEIFRAWLGVTELEDSLDEAKKKAIGSERLRQEIADALDVVFSGDTQGRNYPMWCAYFPDHGRRFEHILRKVTGEQSKKEAHDAVDSRIGGEAFIDDVVARVRRKQLGA